ncbi:gluconate:H+ symporter, GntP family [Raineyella antarctica]|uniref:Gluconate:H+ symporter, GntP family n=1 Tax=Raineyella antarctica TaxID=1577474 RepID=A0A1G6GEL9_9ACTN|nr:SLC13 family permease [Raineyella antarctica]SDB80420.1 gluconate:H+ symporter, GntP family [Raineyella antarctica]
MKEAATAIGPTAIVGLVIAIAVLVFLVMRTKVHALIALIAAASIAALSAGMAPADAIKSITTGFGSTLATIGLVVGFGVMMGRLLEVSGAAEKLAITLVRWLGTKREEWALAVAGYIISIPIFVDSAFVILNPLVKSLSRTSKRSVLTLGIALAGGLVLTHHAVPPTPGPLGAAGIFGVSIGDMILWGLILTLPALVTVTIYARVMGPRIEAMIKRDTGESLVVEDAFTQVSTHAEGHGVQNASVSGRGTATIVEDDIDEALEPKEAFAQFAAQAKEREAQLPSLSLSMLPIVAPILLIFLNTGIAALAASNSVPQLLVDTASFIGNPVIALGIGLLLAIYGVARHLSRRDALAEMEKGIDSAGIILLVTGAGGALGAVLRDSGVGQAIGQWVAGLPLPAILIPFLIATMVRLVQGSGTVAIITAASLSAPIMAQIPGVNMVLAAQAAALGAMVFSYFNDSLFWVVNRMLGVKTVKHQILTWSVPTTVAWATALVTILVADIFV